MPSFVQEILYYLSIDQTHWILSVGLILFFLPLERLFPRIKLSAKSPNILAFFIIAICSYAVIWLFKQSMYLDTISAFLNLQIFSISKSSLSIPSIFIISFLFIDLLVYSFHFLAHKITFLWRLHSVHHIDEHVTVKTAVLHHPAESIASLIYLLFFSVILGIPVVVLILYAGVATLHNFFTHANIALPNKTDRALRLVIVTPDMHRTHHSIDISEGNSNFGQIMSVWDRLFKTYTKKPKSGDEKLIMGLPNSERPTGLSALDLLLHPIARMIKRNKD